MEGQLGCVLDRKPSIGETFPGAGEMNCRQEPGGPQGVDMCHLEGERNAGAINLIRRGNCGSLWLRKRGRATGGRMEEEEGG